MDDAPEGAQIGAIFDLDRTLIAGFSALAFGRDLLRSGHVDFWALQPELAGVLRAERGNGREGPGYETLISILGGVLVGVRDSTLAAIGEELFESDYRHRLHPEALELVEIHRARGHTLVIASAATAYQAEPIARAFGISEVLCTRFETFGGRLTGRVENACWGDGKLASIRAIAENRGIDLTQSYFYSDGIEDLPVLAAVGHPRPTNADEQLAAVAADRGWEVTLFNRVHKPTLRDLARPLAQRRERPGLGARLERALDDQIRMGYRAAHWMRRSVESVRGATSRRD